MKKDFNLSNDIRVFIAEDIINTFLNKVNNSTNFIDTNINHLEFFYNKLVMNATINNRENIEKIIFGYINLDLTFERNRGSLITGASGRLSYSDSNDLRSMSTINLTTIPSPSKKSYNGTTYNIVISIDGEDIKKEYILSDGKLVQYENLFDKFEAKYKDMDDFYEIFCPMLAPRKIRRYKVNGQKIGKSK